jgi:hypothetical protein
MSTIRKIVAQSYERYNGGARVKRQYGSSTVTRFFVEVKGDPSTRMQIEGFGKTPGDRKTFAVQKFMRERGWSPESEPQKEVSPWGSTGGGSRGTQDAWSPRQTVLYEMVKQVQLQGDQMLQGFSGADRADSQRYFIEAQVYRDVAAGKSLDSALAAGDKRWREYAAMQQKKVDEAGKIRRGPMSGHSAIHYKWVDPEAFRNRMSHIAFMVNKAEEATAVEVPSLPPGTTGG